MSASYEEQRHPVHRCEVRILRSLIYYPWWHLLIRRYRGFVSGIGAYVAVDHVRKEVVVSVRGTTNIRNFATDIRFLRKDIDNVVKGGEVHAGFLAAWNEISDTILSGVQDALEANSGYRLVAVGHSLGSGTAAVGASYLRQRYSDVDFFGYGMPRVGNAIFADFFSHDAAGGSTYRIENYNDAAPAIVPRFLGYKHTETEYWLSTGPANKVDYALDEIKVCKGDPNDCSGSLPIKDITGSAHRYILSDLYACGGLKVIP